MVLLNNNQKVNDPYGKNSNSWKMATMYIYYNAIIYFYSENVTIYMMIRETSPYKIGAMLYTFNANQACTYMCKCICMACSRLRKKLNTTNKNEQK